MDNLTQSGSISGVEAPPDPRAFDVGAQQSAPPAPGMSSRAVPPQNAATTPVQPAVADPAEAKHTLVGKLFHGAIAALGANKGETTYSRDDNGNMVAKEGPPDPGQWARGIIAGAMAGMAAGANAPKGSGPLGAAGTGFQAVQDKADAGDKAKRDAADKDYDVQQRAVVQKANMARLNQDIAEKTWDLNDKKVESAFKASERDNEFAQRIASDPNSRDLGVYQSFEDLVNKHKADAPDIIKQHFDGNVLVHPSVDKDGKINGVHFAIVSPEWKTQKLADDSPLPIFRQPSKPGEDPRLEFQTVRAGTMTNGEYEAVQMSHWNQYLSYRHQNEQIDAQKEIADAKAQAAAASADAKNARAETGRGDKSYQFNSTQLENVAKPIDQLVQRLGRLQDTLRQGTPQADALVAPELLTVMAGGPGSGLRMNEAELARIVGGRSNLESLKAAANKWRLDPRTANSITPAQRQQIRELVSTVDTKLKAKQQIIDSSRTDLINTDKTSEHRAIVARTRKQLDDIDSGKATIISPPKMVNMRAPNGQIKPVPADQVEHYKSKGASVVDTPQ